MKWRLTAAVLVSMGAVMISGCAMQVPTQAEAAAADYGDYPANHKAILAGFFRLALKDPETAQYDWGVPYKGWMTKPVVYGGGIERYGWIVNVSVNAKNSYGGFTGYRSYVFLFRGDERWLITTSAFQ